MKKLLLLSATSVLCLVAFGSGDTAAQPLAGRFQLLSAPVDAVVGTSKVHMDRVFKFDTVTGKAWVYEEVFSGGELQIFWRSVQNDPHEPPPTNTQEAQPVRATTNAP